jgi:hypothetical protein
MNKLKMKKGYDEHNKLITGNRSCGSAYRYPKPHDRKFKKCK